MPPDKNPLFYVHGFNSAIPEDISTSPKISAVADFCRCTGRAFHPLNIDYRKAAQHSREILELVPGDVERVIFCGASMGGWFARVMQLLLARQRPELPVEAVIFNPAFNLAEFSHYLEGHQHNYVTLEEYEFKREHSEQLICLERSVDYHADLPLWVYVDAEDEVINAEWSQKWYSGISRFVAYPGGSHSFEHARDALDDFEPGCWNRAGQ